jgi:hypothetical protein
VEGGGDQVVAHVGLHALGSLDPFGVVIRSARVPIDGERLPPHDRGKVPTRRC